MRYIKSAIVFLLMGLFKLFALEGDVKPLAVDFTGKLGWEFQDAVNNIGNPENVFVHRGKTPDEDNVVFYYSDHQYLFWFQDRVWQIRVDERWRGEVDGVSMGMSREAIEELWGPPVNSLDKYLTWTLPDIGFPSRIRLYFHENVLIDMYVYRSDW